VIKVDSMDVTIDGTFKGPIVVSDQVTTHNSTQVSNKVLDHEVSNKKFDLKISTTGGGVFLTYQVPKRGGCNGFQIKRAKLKS
jgi:hypothetical protein